MPPSQIESGARGTDAIPQSPLGPAALRVTIMLALLGALVWTLHPSQPHLTPTGLHPLPPGCPKFSRAFVPANVTIVLDPPTDTLPENMKYKVLYRLNMEACSCGCIESVAACRVSNRDCQTSLQRAKEIVTGRTEPPSPKK
jgi:hypothetical protein